MKVNSKSYPDLRVRARGEITRMGGIGCQCAERRGRLNRRVLKDAASWPTDGRTMLRLAGPYPTLHRAWYEPALELAVEFAPHSVAESIVETTSKRVGRRARRAIGSLILIGRHLVRRLGCLVRGIGGTLHRGGRSGSFLGTQERLKGQDDFFDPFLASPELFESSRRCPSIPGSPSQMQRDKLLRDWPSY